ncbi:hypothetical protein SESBI_28917 [Sesbania bispinosa]|nr:hypothetical protein SESBI_28917 [Sesbania bispinosa]
MARTRRTVRPIHAGSSLRPQQHADATIPTSSVNTPSVWDDTFILRQCPVRETIDNLVYTEKDVAYLETQTPIDLCRQATSTVRNVENSYVPLLKRSEEERKASLDQFKVPSEQNKKLEEASTQLADELKKVNESLNMEKFFRGLAVKEKEEFKTKYENMREQVKNAEDQYLEAKKENDKAQATMIEMKIELEADRKFKTDLQSS